VHRLRKIEHIGIVYMTEADIVRHPLVQRIVQAYEDEGAKKRS
jgi:phosphate starvation-inducible PhoH-like protein